jgi:hypothetical protein
VPVRVADVPEAAVAVLACALQQVQVGIPRASFAFASTPPEISSFRPVPGGLACALHMLLLLLLLLSHCCAVHSSAGHQLLAATTLVLQAAIPAGSVAAASRAAVPTCMQVQ